MSDSADDDYSVIEIKSLEEPKTVDRRAPVVREWLAVGLTAIVGLAILTAILAAALSPMNATVIKDLAGTVIPELIVAYSGVIGYYFGSKHR